MSTSCIFPYGSHNRQRKNQNTIGQVKHDLTWKSDLIYKMKRRFFQVAVVSILLYGCPTWMLTKRLEKKLDSNYTRMFRAILNKSWQQHPTRHQLYGHLSPITKTIKARRTRYAGHCWRSKDGLISDVLLWTPNMAKQKQDDQPEHTYSSYVRILDVAEKTCQRQRMIVRSGERGLGISVLAARHDDDDQKEYYLSHHQLVEFKLMDKDSGSRLPGKQLPHHLKGVG